MGITGGTVYSLGNGEMQGLIRAGQKQNSVAWSGRGTRPTEAQALYVRL